MQPQNPQNSVSQQQVSFQEPQNVGNNSSIVTPSNAINSQHQVDPGRKLAKISIVLAFSILFSGIGLLCSIFAKKKSKKAGFENKLANTSMILNSVFLAFFVLFVLPSFLTSFFNTLSDIQRKERAASQSQPLGTQEQVSPNSELGQQLSSLDQAEATYGAKVNAEQLTILLEAYKSKTGSYPITVLKLADYENTAIPSRAQKHIATSIPTVKSGSQIFYQFCSARSAQIFYYDSKVKKANTIGVGEIKDGQSSCR